VGEAFWLLNQKGGKVENPVENTDSAGNPIEDIVIPENFGENETSAVKKPNEMPF
jgi:hypothetical protein